MAVGELTFDDFDGTHFNLLNFVVEGLVVELDLIFEVDNLLSHVFELLDFFVELTGVNSFFSNVFRYTYFLFLAPFVLELVEKVIFGLEFLLILT